MTEMNIGDEITVKFTVAGVVGVRGVRVRTDAAFVVSNIDEDHFYIPYYLDEIAAKNITHKPAPKPMPTGIGTLIEGDAISGAKQITFIRANISGASHWYSPHTTSYYRDDEITNWRLK